MVVGGREVNLSLDNVFKYTGFFFMLPFIEFLGQNMFLVKKYFCEKVYQNITIRFIYFLTRSQSPCRIIRLWTHNTHLGFHNFQISIFCLRDSYPFSSNNNQPSDKSFPACDKHGSSKYWYEICRNKIFT